MFRFHPPSAPASREGKTSWLRLSRPLCFGRDMPHFSPISDCLSRIAAKAGRWRHPRILALRLTRASVTIDPFAEQKREELQGVLSGTGIPVVALQSSRTEPRDRVAQVEAPDAEVTTHNVEDPSAWMETFLTFYHARCGRFLGAMLASGNFQDDPSCH